MQTRPRAVFLLHSQLDHVHITNNKQKKFQIAQSLICSEYDRRVAKAHYYSLAANKGHECYLFTEAE